MESAAAGQSVAGPFAVRRHGNELPLRDIQSRRAKPCLALQLPALATCQLIVATLRNTYPGMTAPFRPVYYEASPIKYRGGDKHERATLVSVAPGGSNLVG